jgi:ribosomal protein S18 acetylase RimI-like enzyme
MTILRDAGPEDRAAIIDLILALNRHENGISGDRRTDRASAVACLNDEVAKLREYGGLQMVATQDGAVCGYMCCVITQGGLFLQEDKRRYGYITTLVVATDQRGQGLATRLVGEAEAFTRAHGLATLGVSVLTGNAGAERLYEKMGLTPYLVERFKTLD